MKTRSFEEISADINRILEVSHPGNIQLQISDKCVLHQAERITEYDEDDNEILTGLDCSFSFYGEHIQASIKKDDEDYFEVGFAEGSLLSSFIDFIEDDDNSEIFKAIWNAVEKWTIN